MYGPYGARPLGVDVETPRVSPLPRDKKRLSIRGLRWHQPGATSSLQLSVRAALHA
jgi:hypothetical protein